MLDYRFCTAPMMEWSDRHCRMFFRAFSQRAVLFTEMVTAEALIRADPTRLIGFSPAERPLVLQIGGSDPIKMARAAQFGAGLGYDEVNINCGCPSERVQSGAFGACLMREPELVADCLRAMQEAVDIPISVKCRLGVDEMDERATLFRFVETVAEAGCGVFTVHARKAWLKGLSPKENRQIPPLNYALVRELKQERPDLQIILNGGLSKLAEAQSQLKHFDGVMLGRAVYQNPSLLGVVDRAIYGASVQDVSAPEALARYRPYIQAELARGTPLHAMTRHMLGLFQGQKGARHWRRVLSTQAQRPGAGLEVLDAALEEVVCLQDQNLIPSLV